jgi:hypothetical protein
MRCSARRLAEALPVVDAGPWEQGQEGPAAQERGIPVAAQREPSWQAPRPSQATHSWTRRERSQVRRRSGRGMWTGLG